MGNNFCALCINTSKKQKVVEVVKIDGKILTFKEPILVKDVLVSFSSGIGLTKEASEHLPPCYELKKGKVYYMLPSLTCEKKTSVVSEVSSFSSMAGNDQKDGGIKRIKIVITKKRLQELLKKQISVEEVLLEVEKKTNTCVLDNSRSSWKPELESIPEGSD
ncbi:hypothetical protein UlMin_024248 [Ulmus minor]